MLLTMQVLLLLLCSVSGVYLVPMGYNITQKAGQTCGYASCHATPPGVLNVHIVPHTHDDVGWLKTVDQYYYGSRNNIQKAGVQYILDSVIKELWDDPNRRFIYVETAFFWKWWVRQSDDVQSKVQTLIREGRLQMVGGAWSMNDEAASHYQSTLDQFTWGLSKLNKTFGFCGRPRVGWQIDPFGHSREFASLLAMMGYDGLFLGRIDYQDKTNRLHQKSMEMVWRGDDALGVSSDIFTGVLYNTYSPPPGFCFDVLCSDEPIVDDPDSPMYNVETKISVFLDAVKTQARYYKTNNVIMTMGGDFTYQDAHMWYINLDKLIEYANLKAAKDGLKVSLFYSTPDCYLKAIKDASPTLPTKQDDFFPYASDPTAYWTGYFTSRPTTKYFERQGNNYLQMVKQLQVLADLEEHNTFVLNELRSAMGVMQHHDAITGTEKQHVTHDYERLLNQAIDDALIIAKQAFKCRKTINKTYDSEMLLKQAIDDALIIAKQTFNKLTQKDAMKPPIFDFQRCRLNESSCYVSEYSENFVVTIYNPLGWSVKEPVRIPVVDGKYEVYSPDGKQIKTQIVTIPNRVIKIPTRISKATHEIVFIIDLKPLSYKSLYIKKITRTKRHAEGDYEFYNNFNDYWKQVKPDFQNLNTVPDKYKLYNNNPHNEKLNNINDELYNVITQIPIAPVYNAGTIANIEYKDVNLDILKDNDDDQDVNELEKYLKEGRRINKEDRSKVSYPTLTEDEMRMLSDEPRIVEKIDDELVLSNQFYKLGVNQATGLVNKVTLPDQSTVNFTVNMYYYTGCCGDNRTPARRSSGAYIFRPTATSPTKLDLQKTEIVDGDIVKEFRVNLSPNGYLNTKIYDNLQFIETEWIVGPITIDDELGKEYVLRYDTNILNNGEFYTDSNGRQMLKRQLNLRPQWNVSLDEPVAGNYYPVTNEIYIENKDLRLTVLTDRSEGGTSLIEGEIELMLHRRLLCDDAFGVGEALNETAMNKGLVVRGNHRVILGKDNNVIKKNVLGMHLSPQLLFSDAKNIELEDWLKLNNEFSWMDKDLPKGVHLLTLEPWDDKILVRVENYLEKGKNSDVEVDLRDILKTIDVVDFKETLLSANIWADEYEKWVWTKENKAKFLLKDAGNDKCTTVGYKVTLKAKQIRTFVVNYTKKKQSY